MTTDRVILAGLLALLLGVTGLGAAMARGHMAADGVICGTGDRVVVIAADGLPLFDGGGGPVELDTLPCIDCVLGAMALAARGDLPAAFARKTSLGRTSVADPVRSLWRMGGQGRGPPRTA